MNDLQFDAIFGIQKMSKKRYWVFIDTYVDEFADTPSTQSENGGDYYTLIRSFDTFAGIVAHKDNIVYDSYAKQIIKRRGKELERTVHVLYTFKISAPDKLTGVCGVFYTKSAAQQLAAATLLVTGYELSITEHVLDADAPEDLNSLKEYFENHVLGPKTPFSLSLS